MGRRIRESEKVDGTWFKYFHKVTKPVFTDEVCVEYEELISKMYGNFFDRNLSPEKGPLLSLGIGFGLTEIPLARKGYKIIGIDNDIQVLELLDDNIKKYGMGNIEGKFGDLYDGFNKEFIDKNIQACISFGVLEHFKREDLKEIIIRQFQISPLMICMMPINTPKTLKYFKAEKKPEGHIDENGIYRNFWSPEFWENDIFKDYNIIDRCYSTNNTPRGLVNMVTFAIRNNKNL